MTKRVTPLKFEDSSLLIKGYLRKSVQRKSKCQTTNQNVQSKIEVVIPLETCVTVPVLANFKDAATCLYFKKVFNSNRNLEEIYTVQIL